MFRAEGSHADGGFARLAAFNCQGDARVRSAAWLVLLGVLGTGCGGPIPEAHRSVCVSPFVGRVATVKRLPPKHLPPHPLLSAVSSIHSDPYNSDVDDFPGPLGINPVVRSAFIGMSPIVMFGPDGTLMAVTFDLGTLGMGITAIDPESLAVIDRYAVPIDFGTVFSGGFGAQGVSVNGGYYHIDASGRAVVGTQDNKLLELELQRSRDGRRRWRRRRQLDLGPWLPAGQFLIDTQYDWAGNMWFVSSEGVVGYVDRRDYGVRTMRLGGELIENGLAVAPDGVYVLTSEAAYRFEPDETSGDPVYTWRIPYDRGTVPKPGTFALGSGATPTLLGDDLITFTDNADDRVNLLVYRRRKEVEGDRRVGSVPLFKSGASAVDVSMIGYSNSIVVANIFNAGGFGDDYRQLAPGFTRVDVREDRSGLDVVWENRERSTTVSKLSTATGLIYTYTQQLEVADPVDVPLPLQVRFRGCQRNA